MPHREKWTVFEKDYIRKDEIIKPTSAWTQKEFNSERGTEQFVELGFDKRLFLRPKPVGGLQQIIKIGTYPEKNDIILDFFAGSCTAAHAVMALNAEDGGNRKFICVQLAEPCEEESEAFKAGFKTIADIGKERIRRAGKKIKEEMEGNLKFEKNRLDLGFKVFRLEESNFKQWRENIKEPAEFKRQLWEMVDNVKKGAAGEDMLFEIILKNSRFDLNVKVEKQSFDGVDYYLLGEDKKSDLSDGSDRKESNGQFTESYRPPRRLPKAPKLPHSPGGL